MDPRKDSEDALREASCVGDEEAVLALIEKGVDVNAQHSINGWTSLHWAAKRGHSRIIIKLLQHGADPLIQTAKGETAVHLTSRPELKPLLGGEPNGDTSTTNSDREELPITPNYLANPAFPYLTQNKARPIQSSSPLNLSVSHCAATDYKQHTPSPASMTAGHQHCGSASMDEELVLKARVANVAETDFIEVEIDRRQLTFDGLLNTLCKELEVKKELVYKVRKLPDTIVRKDKDVQRLKDFQEMELVLSSRALSESSKSYGPAVSPKHVDVVY